MNRTNQTKLQRGDAESLADLLAKVRAEGRAEALAKVRELNGDENSDGWDICVAYRVDEAERALSERSRTMTTLHPVVPVSLDDIGEPNLAMRRIGHPEHAATVAPVPVTSEPECWAVRTLRGSVHYPYTTKSAAERAARGIVQGQGGAAEVVGMYVGAAPAPVEAGRERVTTKERWQLRRGSDDALLFSSPSKARALNKRQEMHMKGSKLVHIVRYRLVKR